MFDKVIINVKEKKTERFLVYASTSENIDTLVFTKDITSLTAQMAQSLGIQYELLSEDYSLRNLIIKILSLI